MFKRRNEQAVGNAPLTVSMDDKAFELEVVACDFCGSEDFRPFWGRARRFDINTVLCRQCGLCQTNPRQTEAANERFYTLHYNQFHRRHELTDASEYTKRSKRHAPPRVRLLEQFLPASSPQRIFEIGTGAGQFQTSARENKAWMVSGIEPGRIQAEFCRSQGHDVENILLEAVKEPEHRYDAVVSFHVFEHVLSPKAFLLKVRTLLTDDGLLFLEVPNLDRPGGPLDDFLQFPHVYNFTAMTLRNYLNAAGFDVIFTSEKVTRFSMIARMSREPNFSTDPDHLNFERPDVDAIVSKLNTMHQVFMLAKVFPDLPIARKIRAALLAI